MAQLLGGDQSSEQGIPTVTIRANRQTLQERFEAPGSRVIVGREDIEQMGADNISDVLRQLPGVMATTGADGRTEIRMRGMDRSATQILIDGERTSNGRRGGQLPFDQIPADAIERIEVIRAPTAEFSGATGGTINIVLKQSSVRRETSVRLTNQNIYGLNAAQFFLSKSGPVSEPPPNQEDLPPEQRAQPATYFFLLSAYERLGGNERLGSVTNSLKTDSSNSHDVSRSHTKELLLIPRFTIKSGLKDTITINPFLVATNTRYLVNGTVDGMAGSQAFSSSSSDGTQTDRTLARISTTWAHRLSKSRLETRVSLERGRETTHRDFSGSTVSGGATTNALSTLDDSRAENVWNIASKLQGFEGTHVWALGGEIDHRALTASTNTAILSGPGISSNLPYRSEQRRLALWAQNEWTVFEKATVTGGLRVEQLNRDTDSSGKAYIDSWLRYQPSVNLRVPVSDGLQFRAGLAQLTRIPALLDVIDRLVPSTGVNSPTRPDSLGNPLLKPETTLSFDVGFEMRLGGEPGSVIPAGQGTRAGGGQGGAQVGAAGGAGSGQAGGGRAAPVTFGQAGLNFFVREISDPIVRRTFLNSAGRWTQTPENGVSGLAYGLEADMKTPLAGIGLSGWNFNTNASLLKSQGDLSDGSRGRIPGQPHYLFTAGVAKPINRAGGFFGGGNITITGASDLKDSGLSSGRLRAVARLDAFVGQTIRNLGYWRLGFYNLTNAGRNRVRYDLDSVTQNLRTEQTVDRTGRGLYLTIGTQF